MPQHSKVPITATQRLKQDYMRLKKDPIPFITAEPLPSNILEWHYLVTGPADTPYTGGFYHGKLVFPREFPFRPPAIYMITPSGRFKCNTRLCLSISDFHPDTWNPAWSVGTILTGLLSFMVEDTPTLGSVESSDFTKRNLAVCSRSFNIQNKTFCELFPAVCNEIRASIEEKNNSINSEASSQNLSDLSTEDMIRNNQANANRGFANLFIIVGVAAFGFLVNTILKTLN
uniref:Ubiquitin-conjugating enzyme E2 J2 n=1 Tax=Ciona savignyi TaxID=51511 RepID=H2YAR1_CIOSA